MNHFMILQCSISMAFKQLNYAERKNNNNKTIKLKDTFIY